MIEAKIIADSISPDGTRLTTFEVLYPRWILAEVNTHRVFSRSAASTRAVPINKQLEYILDNPAMPVSFGRNQRGMKAETLLTEGEIMRCQEVIKETLDFVADKVAELDSLGLHKQHSGRYLEPWMHVKSVITATEWDNFFALRRHKDAQPEIQELANCMWEARKRSEPEVLEPGEWHVPYVPTLKFDNSKRLYCAWVKYMNDKDNTITFQEISEEDALKVSASCCAQVSYRTLDTSVEKALKIYDALVSSTPVHASPFEHQAMVPGLEEFDININGGPLLESMPEGFTHEDRFGNMWSGNFKGWIQHRQLLPEHTVWDYQEE